MCIRDRLTGIDIVVQEPYRTPTIVIAIILTTLYISYNIYKLTICRIILQNKELIEQSGILIEQNERLVETRNPNCLIEDNIRYQDVEFAVYCLTKQITESEFLDKDNSGKYDTIKNIIIGVDRGGAIVGGMLAKNLGLAIHSVAIFYANPPQSLHREGKTTSVMSDKCLEDIDFENITNILLVDDVTRTGITMRAAYDKIEEYLIVKGKSDINIKIVTILCELVDKNQIIPDFSVYKTRHLRIKLPWDQMHFYEEMILEKNKKKEFEDLCEKMIVELDQVSEK